MALIKEQVGDKKVLLALSGGVDSSVVAALLIKAIGQQLVCVHVNHGLFQKGEQKNDIKAHHNAGGLPEDMNFELVEPVRILFKDEVRVVGEELGLPHGMVYRQPFPGSGLGVRVPGAITRDRLEAVRESDAILRTEIVKNGLDEKIWQYFTVVPEFRSTGIKDGKRSFEWCCIVRAVCTTDVMAATVAEIPHEVMVHITDRITHEVPGINRVLYDFTPKPTGTVEFE